MVEQSSGGSATGVAEGQRARLSSGVIASLTGVGLLLAGCRARDVGAVVTACRDLWRHFGLVDFLRAMSTAIRLRCPHRADPPPPSVVLGHGR